MPEEQSSSYVRASRSEKCKFSSSTVASYCRKCCLVHTDSFTSHGARTYVTNGVFISAAASRKQRKNFTKWDSVVSQKMGICSVGDVTVFHRGAAKRQRSPILSALQLTAAAPALPLLAYSSLVLTLTACINPATVRSKSVHQGEARSSLITSSCNTLFGIAYCEEKLELCREMPGCSQAESKNCIRHHRTFFQVQTEQEDVRSVSINSELYVKYGRRQVTYRHNLPARTHMSDALHGIFIITDPTPAASGTP